jgi:NADPH-dependent FMN reductase
VTTFAPTPPVRVLCIGGSTRPNSSSEKAIRVAAAAAEAAGATVELIVSRDLILPVYDTETPDAPRLAEPAGRHGERVGPVFGADGACTQDSARFQLETILAQVVDLAARRTALSPA